MNQTRGKVVTNGTEMPTEVVFILAFHLLYLNVECYNEASLGCLIWSWTWLGWVGWGLYSLPGIKAHLPRELLECK